MRALYLFLFSIMIAALSACNDSSSSGDSAGSNVAGSPVEENTNTAGVPENRGSLGEIVDYADAGVHGKVVSIEDIWSNDEYQIPHQLVNIQVTELLFGDIEDDGTNTVSVRFVGGNFNDGSNRQIEASNNPDVNVGDEVVALITEHDNHPCTLTQCSRGLFQIKAGSVFAHNESLVAVNKNHEVKFISKGGQASGQYKAIAAESSVANFKQLLTKLGKTSDAKAKNRRVKIASFNKGTFTASPGLTGGVAAPSNNEEHEKSVAKAKEARAKYLASLSAKDRWEEEEVERNGGNPVLQREYLGEGQQ